MCLTALKRLFKETPVLQSKEIKLRKWWGTFFSRPVWWKALQTWEWYWSLLSLSLRMNVSERHYKDIHKFVLVTDDGECLIYPSLLRRSSSLISGCVICVLRFILRFVSLPMCLGEQQLNSNRPSGVDGWPMTSCRKEDWPMRRQGWLDVIYVPDIFNRITRDPFQCDYCDAQSWCLCVTSVLFLFSPGPRGTDLDTTSENHQTGRKHHFFFRFSMIVWCLLSLPAFTVVVSVYLHMRLGQHGQDLFCSNLIDRLQRRLSVFVCLDVWKACICFSHLYLQS